MKTQEKQSQVAQAIQAKAKASNKKWDGASFQQRAELVSIKGKANLKGIPSGPIWILKAMLQNRDRFVFVLEVETRLLYICPDPIPEYVRVPIGTEVTSGERKGILREIDGEKTICWD